MLFRSVSGSAPSRLRSSVHTVRRQLVLPGTEVNCMAHPSHSGRTHRPSLEQTWRQASRADRPRSRSPLTRIVVPFVTAACHACSTARSNSPCPSAHRPARGRRPGDRHLLPGAAAGPAPKDRRAHRVEEAEASALAHRVLLAAERPAGRPHRGCSSREVREREAPAQHGRGAGTLEEEAQRWNRQVSTVTGTSLWAVM